MHSKSSQTPTHTQDNASVATSSQLNHRTLKHAFYAAGASATLSLLLMTGCSCSPNQDALETIPDTGASTTINTTVQANPENQAASQADSQDVTKYSATAQNTQESSASSATVEEIQAAADARVQAAQDAQRQAEEAESQLETELAAAQKAQAEAEAAAQTARDEKDALQKELEVAQSSQSTAETNVQALSDEKEALVADMDALIADNEKLTTDLQTAQAAQTKAEQDAQAAQEAQAKAEEAQTKAETDLATAKDELTSTTTQLQKAQEAIQAVEDSTKANAEELAAAQAAQKQAEADLAQAQEDLKSSNAAKDAAEAEAEQVKQENASLVEANAAAEEARTAAEEQAAAAQAAQAEAEAKVEAGLLAEADVQAAQAAQAKAEEEAQAAKDAQAQAERDKQQLQAEKDALQAQLDALNAGTGTTPQDPTQPADPTDPANPAEPAEPTPSDAPGSANIAPDNSSNDNLLDVGGTTAHRALRPSRFDAENYFVYGMAVRPSLGAYSWDEIAHIASLIEARATTREEAIDLAKEFHLVNDDGTFTGETKALTLTDGQTVDVLLVDIFHDYTELDEPTAFTFMLATNYTNQAMNESGTNEGGWELSDMRYWLNGDVIEKLPDALYYSVKPVQKFTNNVGNTDNPENVTATTDLLFLFSWAECLGPLAWNEGTDLAFIDAINNAEGSQYAWFAQNGVAGDQNNPTLIRTNKVVPASPEGTDEAATADSDGIDLAAEPTSEEQTPATSQEGQEITWWMRSSDPSSATNFGDMGPEIENGSVASTPEGVVFGFCL